MKKVKKQLSSQVQSTSQSKIQSKKSPVTKKKSKTISTNINGNVVKKQVNSIKHPVHPMHPVFKQPTDYIIINDNIYQANTITQRTNYNQFLTKVKKEKQIQRKSFLINKSQISQQPSSLKKSTNNEKRKMFEKLSPKDFIQTMTLQQKKQMFYKLRQEIRTGNNPHDSNNSNNYSNEVQKDYRYAHRNANNEQQLEQINQLRLHYGSNYDNYEKEKQNKSFFNEINTSSKQSLNSQRQRISKFNLIEQKLQNLKLQLMFKWQAHIDRLQQMYMKGNLTQKQKQTKVTISQKIKDHKLKILDYTKTLFEKILKQEDSKFNGAQQKSTKIQAILQSLHSFPSLESMDQNYLQKQPNINHLKILKSPFDINQFSIPSQDNNINIQDGNASISPKTKINNIQSSPLEIVEIQNSHQAFLNQFRQNEEENLGQSSRIKQFFTNENQKNYSQQYCKNKQQISSLERKQKYRFAQFQEQEYEEQGEQRENDFVTKANGKEVCSEEILQQNYQEAINSTIQLPKNKQNSSIIYHEEIQEKQEHFSSPMFKVEDGFHSPNFKVEDQNFEVQDPNKISLKLDLRLDEIVFGQDQYPQCQKDETKQQIYQNQQHLLKEHCKSNIQTQQNQFMSLGKNYVQNNVKEQQTKEAEISNKKIIQETSFQQIERAVRVNKITGTAKQSMVINQCAVVSSIQKFILLSQSKKQSQTSQAKNINTSSQVIQEKTSLSKLHLSSLPNKANNDKQTKAQSVHLSTENQNSQDDSLICNQQPHERMNINIPLILTRDKMQTLQYQRNRAFKQNLDRHIAFQMGCFDYQSIADESKSTVSSALQSSHFTTLVDINNYIIGFYEFMMGQCLNALVDNLNIPYGKSVVDKLYSLKADGYVLEENYNQLNNILKQANFIQFQRQLTLTTRKCSEFQTSHNRAIFQAFTKCINVYRPYYQLEGEVYPWVVSQKGITFYEITQENIQEVFQKSKIKVLEYCTTLCGLHPPSDIRTQDQKKLIHMKQQQNLNKMIKTQIIQQFQQWSIRFVDYQCLIRLIVAEQIYNEIIVDCINDINMASPKGYTQKKHEDQELQIQ